MSKFDLKMNLVILAISKNDRKWALNGAKSVGISIFDFFVNFRVVLANPEKKNFHVFSIFSAKIRDFGIFGK